MLISDLFTQKRHATDVVSHSLNQPRLSFEVKRRNSKRHRILKKVCGIDAERNPKVTDSLELPETDLSYAMMGFHAFLVMEPVMLKSVNE